MGITSIVASVTALAMTFMANPVIQHGLHIAAIVAFALILQQFIDRIIERVIRRAITPDRHITPDEERRREDTLIRIIDGTARVVIWFVAAFAVLTELGMSTTPFVTAAGTIGLAMSIGGQHVTRDILVGACMVLEDQYRVGDTVRVNGTVGVVRDITLRVTVLHGEDGALHYMPHGLITAVANLRARTEQQNTPLPAP